MAGLACVTGQAHAAPSLRQLIELTDMSSLSVSPDGRLVAYRSEQASIDGNRYDLRWNVVPADGSAPPRVVGDGGEGEPWGGMIADEPPVWTADSSAIIYREVKDGEVQLWRADVVSGKSEQLTHDPANVRAFALVPGTGAVVYATGATRWAIASAEQDEYDRGILIDATVDPARPLFRSAWIDGRLASDRLTGGWFFDGTLLSDAPRTYHVIDPASGSERVANAEEAALVAPDPAAPSPVAGKRIAGTALSGDVRGTAYALAEGTQRRLVVRYAGSRVITCSAQACHDHIVHLAWAGRSNALLFTTRDRAMNDTLYVWYPETGQVRRIGGGEGSWNGGRTDQYGCTLSDTAAFCVAASANSPPRLIRIEITDGSERVLADPDASLLHIGPEQFRAVNWRDHAGRRFAGQLMLPAGVHEPVPLFITYYTCDGYLRGGAGDEFPLRQIAGAGIAALCVNRQPTTPGPIDQVAQYREAQSGITAIVAQLARERVIDPDRVGMGGVSFGGEVTMWIATHSRLLAAMSISNTLLSDTYYWFNAMPGRQVPEVLRKVWGLGDPDTDGAHWREIAPTLNIASIHAPLLMQMPAREFRLNVELAARLGRAGKPVELWAFPGETHLKYQPRHKLAIYQRNLDWFRFWLQDYVDPDPAKAQQYGRWRAMADQLGANRSATSRAHTSASMIGRSR